MELLCDDAERHIEAIRSGLELAASDVLVDGKFTLDAEKGLTIEIDFGVPAGNMPTVARPWSDPTSDPIRDEHPNGHHRADRGTEQAVPPPSLDSNQLRSGHTDIPAKLRTLGVDTA
ncbi:major capsid protein [Kitasatospora griseola]|uniref:major capsid protein n=1 Tax=Kitasatospora griseola TaxID=2064 RepID=UPI003855CE89